MSIEEQLQQDLKAAMKAKDKVALGAIRGVKKVILEAKTSKDFNGEITDADCIKIITKLSKQGKDAAGIYKEQGREDLFDEEMAQVHVYEKYLPKQLSVEELETVVKDIITELGASSMKDMGKVMGVASKKLAGKADGKLISEQVKKALA
ncbi:GatB/YqeY domain-containing protein [Marinilabiliaceae bacterium JC040]|nr:GatB/YqeY domain-containing protein [Marinilabiliaceae bacterium JC040]